MAVGKAAKADIAALCRSIEEDAAAGIFKPVYLLMGDEPYYPEKACQAILDNCIDEFGKDFNETVCYGADVTAERIVTEAREFPMMTERRLIVVKEAQMMKGIEDLSVYCAEPLDSTVLVLLLHKATVDKRRTLFKTVQKIGIVMDSPALRDYEVPGWIQEYYRAKRLSIDPGAATLLAESAGTDLSTIAVETDKLLKSLPEGTTRITETDIEKNVGISRQFSIFELTNALSFKDAPKAFKIASHLGNTAKFAMPMATSALYTHFNRILKYGALAASGTSGDPNQKARALQGVNPYFYKEYDVAIRNYPLPKAMAAMSILCEYDYLGKGGDGGAATQAELLTELTAKLLSL